MNDDRLGRLWAYEQIRQLVARYAHAVDTRDLDSLVALFVDDVHAGRGQRGRGALRAQFDASLTEVGVTILSVGTHVIDLIDDDHATGAVYCRGEIQVDDRWIVQAIRYDDTYERRDGDWLFVRRHHQLFYGAEAAVNPLGLPAANWPENHEGLGSLPYSDDSWRTFRNRDQDRPSTG
ncbi:MAG: nuclear transport factor 2 family protein [Acidimicrobiia bacterium]|nr:nuclear transport factor 2 family protein [Acidimicrobiia bacterium]